jgi:hypothetical protein
MAPPTEDLAVAWASLAVAGDGGDGWRSITISPAGSTLVHAGRRFPDGAESILARFSSQSIPPATKWPEGDGFTVEPASIRDGSVWVALTRRKSASLELFSAMSQDVASELARCPANEDFKAFATLLGRVRAWQEFMRKGGQPLGPEEEIGLFGEISTLLMLIAEGVDRSAACDAWKGPVRGLRDFEIGTGGIEVKTSISATGFPARVSTLSQLDDTDRQPLFLVAIRLRQAQVGRTLADAVQLARDAVADDAEAKRTLDDRLIASGYREAHAHHYLRRFEPNHVRSLKIGPGFPRLTPNSVPFGVVEARYEIDVDRATVQSIDFGVALQELGAV